MTPAEIRRPLPLTPGSGPGQALPLRESLPLPAIRGEGWGEGHSPPDRTGNDEPQ